MRNPVREQHRIVSGDVPRHGQVVRRSPERFHASNGQTAGLQTSGAWPRGRSGRTLEPEDRQFFESRFGHSFADVRVYADHEANESARSLQARAYTMGNTITFGHGEYQPGTTAGRSLIAHELVHVLQQRSAPATSRPLIQRQPKGAPPRQSQKTTPKPKSLSESGVDVVDPVHSGTAQLIDQVLLRSKRLAPYIGDKLKKGFRIAEKGKFVQELSDGNFENAYRAAYGVSTVPRHVMGFYDSKKSVIHLRPDATFGTALHESMHRLASPAIYSSILPAAMKVSEELGTVLKEGVTAYFTDIVLKDEGLTAFTDAYSRSKKKAAKLVTALGSDGFDLIAEMNFKFAGVVKIGNKLGLSTNQYMALKGRAFNEVLKRMDAAL